jgi:hypothetical protein
VPTSQRITQVCLFIVAAIGFVILSLIPILGSIVALLAIYAIGAAVVYLAYKDVFEPTPAATSSMMPPGSYDPPPPPAPPPPTI